MTSTLLDQLRSTFTSAAVNDLARILGEDTASTQKAVDGLMPALTSGVINRASSNEGAATLYQLLKSTPFNTDPSLNQLVKTSDHRQKAADSGNDLLRQLFRDQSHRLAEATAQYSRVGVKSATTLTGLVMSVLMGLLHNQVTRHNLSEAQLVTMLRSEADAVRGTIPAALAGALGWLIGTGGSRPITPVPNPTTVRTEPVTHTTDDKPSGTPWWRWLLYLLIPLLLLLLLLRNCRGDKTDTETTTQTESTQTAPTGGAAVATDTVASDPDGNERATQNDSTGQSANAAGPEVRVGVDLPGGRKLNVVENSFNYALATYLAQKNSKTPKLFTFDNLTFETNSAEITAKARPNVDDLIQIMQAYPSMAIRIEGNTDSTGDDAINDPLSGERAEAVKQALIKGGIAANRIATREEGDRKPVATNKTEGGRQKNRRIDVIVTKV